MKILIFDTHLWLSVVISPYELMQRHFSDGCLVSSEKACGVNVRSQWEASSSEKLFSENNWFCQSNLEEQRKYT